MSASSLSAVVTALENVLITQHKKGFVTTEISDAMRDIANLNGNMMLDGELVRFSEIIKDVSDSEVRVFFNNFIDILIQWYWFFDIYDG